MRKSQFKDIVASEISRDGINDLMQYIKSRDFFVAPASTRFHNAFDGCLCDNIEEWKILYRNNSRKVYADLYIDDKACRFVCDNQ